MSSPIRTFWNPKSTPHSDSRVLPKEKVNRLVIGLSDWAVLSADFQRNFGSTLLSPCRWCKWVESRKNEAARLNSKIFKIGNLSGKFKSKTIENFFRLVEHKIGGHVDRRSLWHRREEESPKLPLLNTPEHSLNVFVYSCILFRSENAHCWFAQFGCKSWQNCSLQSEI